MSVERADGREQRRRLYQRLSKLDITGNELQVLAEICFTALDGGMDSAGFSDVRAEAVDVGLSRRDFAGVLIELIQKGHIWMEDKVKNEMGETVFQALPFKRLIHLGPQIEKYVFGEE